MTHWLTTIYILCAFSFFQVNQPLAQDCTGATWEARVDCYMQEKDKADELSETIRKIFADFDAVEKNSKKGVANIKIIQEITENFDCAAYRAAMFSADRENERRKKQGLTVYESVKTDLKKDYDKKCGSKG